MKKIHLLVALTALFLVGSVAWASFYPIEDPQLEMEVGVKYFIRGPYVNGTTLTSPRWLGVQTINGVDIPYLRESDTAGDAFVMSFEEANEEITIGEETYPAYFIKNESTGKYLAVIDDSEGDHYDTSTEYVSDREKATPWAVSKAERWQTDEETGERYNSAPEECFVIRTLAPIYMSFYYHYF